MPARNISSNLSTVLIEGLYMIKAIPQSADDLRLPNSLTCFQNIIK